MPGFHSKEWSAGPGFLVGPTLGQDVVVLLKRQSLIHRHLSFSAGKPFHFFFFFLTAY